MESKELTIIQHNDSMTAHSFKSDATRKAVCDIIAAYGKAAAVSAKLKDEYDAAKDAAYKAIAPILAKLKSNKAWEAEGFKTWRDFVNATLPITDRQATSILTYQRKVADVPALKDFSVANVNELTAADNDALKKAIESKEITPETKQADLSDFAKSHKPAGKTKVEPRFNIWAINNESIKYVGVIKADFAKKMDSEQVVFLPAPQDGSPRRFIAYDNAGFCVMCAFVPYVKAADSKKSTEQRKPTVYDQFRAANEWAANLPDDAIQSMFDRMKKEQGK